MKPPIPSIPAVDTPAASPVDVSAASPVDVSAAPPPLTVVAVEDAEECTTGRLIKNGLSIIFGCC